MNASVENEGSAFDKVKWLVIIAVLAAAVVGNSFYGETSILIRAGLFIVAVGISLFLAAQTDKGRTFLTFAKESKLEVRKVVWPSRQEATHTTIIIALTTLVVALFMWGLDASLLWLVGKITGLRF